MGIQRFEEALKIDPDFITIMQALALDYSNKRGYEKALGRLDKMRQIQPDKADIYYHISCIKAKQGSLNESVEWLRRAFQKDSKIGASC